MDTTNIIQFNIARSGSLAQKACPEDSTSTKNLPLCDVTDGKRGKIS